MRASPQGALSQSAGKGPVEEVTLEEGHESGRSRSRENTPGGKVLQADRLCTASTPGEVGVQPTGLSTSKLSTASPAPPTPTPASGRRAKDSPRTHGPLLGKLLGAHFLRSDHGP